jgi:hypothetical protein
MGWPWRRDRCWPWAHRWNLRLDDFTLECTRCGAVKTDR